MVKELDREMKACKLSATTIYLWIDAKYLVIMFLFIEVPCTFTVVLVKMSRQKFKLFCHLHSSSSLASFPCTSLQSREVRNSNSWNTSLRYKYWTNSSCRLDLYHSFSAPASVWGVTYSCTYYSCLCLHSCIFACLDNGRKVHYVFRSWFSGFRRKCCRINYQERRNWRQFSGKLSRRRERGGRIWW
jgi:hypothetical protein